jgi:hypothetical protein
MANEVCVLLQEIARNGQAVVAILHNPTALSFSLFDQLMMLDKTGRTTYFGPRRSALSYMESIGYTFPRDFRYSFVEWLVETMSCGGSAALRAARAQQDGAEESQPEQKTASEGDFATLWSQNPLSLTCQPETEEELSPIVPRKLPSSHAGFFRSMGVLIWYRTTGNYKSMAFVFPRLLDKIIFELIIMSLYWNIGNNSDPQSLQSTAAMLFFIAVLCGFGAASVVPSITLERPLFSRERSDGCFKASTYWCWKLLQEAMLAVLTSVIFSNMVFWATGLSGSFGLFLLVYCK